MVSMDFTPEYVQCIHGSVNAKVTFSERCYDRRKFSLSTNEQLETIKSPAILYLRRLRNPTHTHSWTFRNKVSRLLKKCCDQITL